MTYVKIIFNVSEILSELPTVKMIDTRGIINKKI